MKKKTLTPKRFTPLSAAVAGAALAAVGAHAQSTPVFIYDFPASWSGTGTTVTDLSSAGDTGTTYGTPTLSTSAVPPGAPGGTSSLVTTGGGITTSQISPLNNAAVAAAGGFTYNVDFDWNGTFSTSFSGVQKIIDYSGTESLELIDSTSATSATLEMTFDGDAGSEVTDVSMTIVPNTWYNTTMTFYTEGNAVVAGDISGLASLSVNGGTPVFGAVTKGTYGDSLDRGIGVGQLAIAASVVKFDGDIYDPNVALGTTAAVPEPSTLALSLMGGVSGLGMMWNSRKRKA